MTAPDRINLSSPMDGTKYFAFVRQHCVFPDNHNDECRGCAQRNDDEDEAAALAHSARRCRRLLSLPRSAAGAVRAVTQRNWHDPVASLQRS